MVEAAERAWRPTDPWSGISPAQRATGDAGVRVVLCPDRGQVDILAHDGKAAALIDVIAAVYGARLDERPRACAGRAITFLWAGPHRWTARAADPRIAADLARHLDGLAAVVDQSASRVVLQMSGPKVRETLAKGVLVDLHPRAFGPGDVALTQIAHIGAQIWQIDAAPTFEIAVFRSLAGSFFHWLEASAAPYGITIEAASAMSG